MEIRLIVQSTPNPNALKFVINTPVKTDGNVTYKSGDSCEYNPVAKAFFEASSDIIEVYFFDNYITVTQNGNADWDTLEESIRSIISEKMPDHDPNFQVEEEKIKPPFEAQTGPDIDKINAILNETVRPALQMDGGDIQIVSYKDNVVEVFYQGACGSCPSSSAGTMMAIQNILQDQFNPDVTVEIAETVS